MTGGTMRPARPVFLIGFMGSGKTTVGRLLALRLGVPFVDLDDEIATAAGARSAAELFRREGEAAFRHLEAQAVTRLGPAPRVVATGGGAPTREESLRSLLATGTVVALATPLEECLARASRDPAERPLLQGAADGALRIALLYTERRAAYARAHLVVSTADRAPDAIAEEIAGKVLEREATDGTVVRVALGAHGYDVIIARGILSQVGERIRERLGSGPVGLLTEPKVRALHAGPVGASLAAAGLRPIVVLAPEGEAAKTLSQVEIVADQLAREGLDRHRPLLAFGGGAIGDLAGVVAATLFRGVPLVHLPTTLLAQADSAIGGKAAVNLPSGKNLLGAFHQPALVLSDPDLLATLDDRDIASGLAEIIKHALLADVPLLARLEALPDGALRPPAPELLAMLVARSVAIKAAVVAEDERDTGSRTLLNLGHTVGHAIEAAAGYGSLRHGEAVALGLVAACRISLGLGLCSPSLCDRVVRLLTAAGLPTDLDPWLREPLLDLIAVDKKRAGDVIRFVALRAPGEPEIVPLRLAELGAKLLPRGAR